MSTRSWRLRLALVAALLVSAAVASSSSPSSSSASEDDDGANTIPALADMDAYDVVGIVFMACGLAVSAAGGVGGGVIMVPAMVLIMSFDIKRATPISNMAILGGAVANAWFNLRKRHPAVDRPLIDADLSLAMIPVVIGGAVVGALLSKLLPSYLISLLFVVVLVGSGTRTMQKGIKLHKKERAAAAAAQKAQAEADAQDAGAPSPSAANYTEARTPTVPEQARANEKAKESSFAAGEESKEEVLARILDKERAISWPKQAAILVCYLGVVASSILGKVVDCGGVAYWVLLLVEIPWVAVFAVLTSVYLLKDHRRKLAVDYPFADGDVQWNKKTVIWFPLGCAGAGIIAGLFGVGGAIITGPMIIEIGVVPEVASANSALMVLFSAAAATAKFAVFDMIAWGWAGLLCGVGFVVTSASQIVILGYVRKTGKQSIIVLCIGVSILLGAALMTYQSIKSTIDSYDDPFTVDVCN